MKSLLFLSFMAFLIGAGLFAYGRTGMVARVNPQMTVLEKHTLARQLRAALAQSSQNKPEAGIFVEPIAEFRERITKKTFGMYITPETSPIQPDRFDGYHTGVDVEYGDVLSDVSVHAIAEGTVVLSKIATGYGGVLVIRHTINEKDILVLYGHLDPESLPQGEIGHVERGQRIGVLGEGGTDETDGVRKHLHFAMLKKETIDIRGYVDDPEDLADWYDPLDFYAERADAY